MCYQVLNFEFMHECVGYFNTKVSFSQNVLQGYVWSYNIYYSAASSLPDRSKCFTLHTLVYVFISTQIRLLREAFSYAAINVRIIHSRSTTCS